jgi:hypothetical protein
MDAIKKKMQGMKLEKDNAMDRALLCEQQARDANARAEKVNTKCVNNYSPYGSLKIDYDQLNYDDAFIN